MQFGSDTYLARVVDGPEGMRKQLLIDHLTSVAQMSESFAASFDAGELARVTGLCHDIGKYSGEFQRRLLDPRIRVDHSTAGARVLCERYGSIGQLLAYAVAGHHSGIPNGGNEHEEGSLICRVRRKDLVDYSAFRDQIELPSKVPYLNLTLSKGTHGFALSFFVRMLFSCLVDSDYLDAERFGQPLKSAYRIGARPIEALETRLTNHLTALTQGAPPTVVNQRRAEVLQDCLSMAELPPGLFTLTVPTGGGKTLSSLAFALKHARLHGLRRVIYVIPFTSIIEQNAEVFRKAIGSEAVLEHHSNVMRQEQSGEGENITRFDLAEENWDMPVIVTTNVQFFESLFSNRGARCRKLHNVTRSVVILDEAQMLPIELLKPCVAALEELIRNYGVSIVLCSATQPALDMFLAEGTQSREIVRDPKTLYESLRRVRVKNAGCLTDTEVSQTLLDHEQALCIVNTRGHARRLFELMGRAEGHYHLSAAMCPVHRSKKLFEIRKRLAQNETCRVISTQLIEAGVDVDFPFVMRAMAGIDSIAQAAGRCNREGRLTSGETVVFKAAEEEPHVWFRRTASIASSILDKERDPLALESVRRYFQDLYFYEEPNLDVYEIIQRCEYLANHLLFPFQEVADLFKIIQDSTLSIVIPFDEECRRLVEEVKWMGISRQRVRQLQRYSVSVHTWEHQRLKESGLLVDIGGLSVLDNMQAYHCDFGLTLATGDRKDGDAWIV